MTTIAIPCNHPARADKDGVIHIEIDSRNLDMYDLFFADVDKIIKKLSKDDPDSMRIARDNFRKYNLEHHVASNGRYDPIRLRPFSYSRPLRDIPLVGLNTPVRKIKNDLCQLYRNIFHDGRPSEFPLRFRMSSWKSEGLFILQALDIKCIPINLEKYRCDSLWLNRLKREIGTESPEVFENRTDLKINVSVSLYK